MRVLIISFFNRWITHLGTELELAQRHLDRQDSVSFLSCDGSVQACLLNSEGSRRMCDECRLRRSVGLSMLQPKVEEFQLGNYLPDVSSEDSRIDAQILDADSARSFRHDGQDLGWGALSSAIMKLRDPFCESDEAKALLRRFAKAALRSYAGICAFLAAHPAFDCVYIFNGRFECARGALRACQAAGIPRITTHERGSSPHTYQLFENALPHDREWWHAAIERQWTDAPVSVDREAVGRSYFENRRRGSPADWKSFVTEQQAGLLPGDWDASKINVAIFTSSEDEFTGIGEAWRNSLYRAQSEGIARLIGDARSLHPRMHFHVRMHPNLKGVRNSEVDAVLNIRAPNCTVIEPSSDVSSYGLLDASDRVVTFGSTMGIEATYWNKVSLLAGHALYEHMDAAYLASSHEHLLRLLGSDVPPKPRANAIKYGFCMQTFGIPFDYWQPDGFEDGRFRGRPLNWSSRTNLERRILIECLDHGVHSARLHDAVSGISKLGSDALRSVAAIVHRAHG